MEFSIDRKLLKQKEAKLSTLMSQISSGKAILFTGAGFSRGTKNIDGQEPPISRELSIDICRLGGFEDDEDLRYSADYYSYHYEKEELIKLLKKKFTLTEVSEVHEIICRINWRRFYTTNYDNSIEISARRNKKMVECIDTTCPTIDYYKREGLCIHINGSIDSLTTESLESSFKLSTSSYISSDSFLNSDWFYYFKKDLERSSAIIFIGYSLYDIEIQKILYENDTLQQKTYFITERNPDRKLTFTLSKFGYILPIGIDGFSKLIIDNNQYFCRRSDDYYFQSLNFYKLTDENDDIRDSSIETFLMYGDIDDKHIDNGICGKQKTPYLILRDDLKRILEFTLNKKNTIICSDLGNGKTILLKELRTYLNVHSFDVYEIEDWDGDFISDIDYLGKSNKRTVLIVDDYEQVYDLIRHYSKSLPTNINIIASARTAEHDRLRNDLSCIGFEYNEVNIDDLTENESSEFINIIDNVGLWGKKAGLSHRRKQEELLRYSTTPQISESLLYILNAPQIQKRISSLIKTLARESDHKDTIFAIALIEILGLKSNFSLISNISGNNSIYDSQLLQKKSFKNLFKKSGNKILPKSSLYCLSLIINHFENSYVIEQLLRIATHFNKYKNKNHEQNRIFKSMLRFSQVERLFSDKKKKVSLKQYYEDLKANILWLKNDPHYWLQYGMANITFQDYNRAQKYIEQAYALSYNRPNYHTANIDTQQARLYIIVAMNHNDSSTVFDYFNKGHNLLSRLDNDIYKFRQVQNYRKFFNNSYHKLSKKNKGLFVSACKSMLNQIKKGEAMGDVTPGDKTIENAKNSLKSIVEST